MLRRASSSTKEALPLSTGQYGQPRNGYGPRHSGYGAVHAKDHKRGSGGCGGYLPWAIVLLACILCAGFSLNYRAKYNNYRDKLGDIRKQLLKHQTKYRALEKQLRDLERKRKEAKDKKAKDKTVDKRMSHLESMQKRSQEVARDKNIKRLEAQIQRMSHREVMEIYGAGPYRVKFDVIFPTDEGIADPQGATESFTVELASVDEMPHSILFFLEQVYHELWNGATFVLNAKHIFQAGPHSLTKDSDLLHKFQSSELQKLAFQEYHEKWPHVKFTIGYAGRPAGPDWYINKIDNTEAHGPGGQVHHALKEEADPCFGKVTDGFDVVEKLFRVPGYGRHGILEKRVYIKSATVLGIE
mmetsp:Transcript_38245/g.46665  ORF Transcript_38245/g.46665 Transcript_38245/m.46665 type:complete len:356 (+) Transcript_38245:181-1248(+)|eukprot:CAMPEP_0172517910 /NCGR_PEP_ID=MMETSP1066-20121228/288893_1 /TAXON_ID=671091 /ORGANISM="Coscinodiscus wailesii, Strain CCMP2513" /LENGTH=355 /DNA_ID=CAMNT_0013300121 /DNA_START=181 /DNA_END=1248 /DNA_ORIENTATION=-